MIAYIDDDRLDALFDALAATFGDSHPVCAAVGLSTHVEDIRRGTVGDLRTYFAENEPAAALTLVIGGVPERVENWDETQVRAALQARLDAGDSLSYAAKAVATESGWKKSEIYELGKSIKGA
jgi:16S rRNA (cytidine1402-2'-O)-methyltransferase